MLKKHISLFLSLSLLASCAAPAGENSPAPTGTGEPAPSSAAVTEAESPSPAEAASADAVARAIAESQPDPEGYAAQTGEDLDFYLTLYGVGDYFLKDAAVYTAGGVDAREIVVLCLDSMNNDFSQISAALEEYRQDREADFFGYAPEQAALVERGVVVGGWGCAALLLCQDVEAAQAAFERAAGGAEGGEPLPGFSPAETRWFVAFTPPNQVDMTLYDTAPILAAWETGDRVGLSEKDAAILSAAEEALAIVPQEASDYERELLLHDWLLDHCTYDDTAHAPRTPAGREHSRDPYGPLVEGTGICLGYATTFQLLMDLTGVECITVVGASKESRQDHAWNMVKLDGEWYCVDPTWNDTGDREEEKPRHTLFNCTSDYMRETNHQWDYANTPRATATRFRWDGISALSD